MGDVCSFAQMDVRKHGNPTVIMLKIFADLCLEISLINLRRSKNLFTSE